MVEWHGRNVGDGTGRAGLAAEPAGVGPALHPLLQGLLRSHQVPHYPLHPRPQANRHHQGNIFKFFRFKIIYIFYFLFLEPLEQQRVPRRHQLRHTQVLVIYNSKLILCMAT